MKEPRLPTTVKQHLEKTSWIPAFAGKTVGGGGNLAMVINSLVLSQSKDPHQLGSSRVQPFAVFAKIKSTPQALKNLGVCFISTTSLPARVETVAE
tara:strand:- start:1 stop:288 length:288 start_codon:yes stop_codon:yes gene_type:complete